MLFEHIATCPTNEDACHIEQLLINSHRTKSPHGYNMTLGGEGAHGYEPTDEVRANWSRGRKGRVWSEDQNNARAEAVRAQWADPEFRKRRSESMKKPKKEGFREMRSQMMTGKKPTPESVKKRADAMRATLANKRKERMENV